MFGKKSNKPDSNVNDLISRIESQRYLMPDNGNNTPVAQHASNIAHNQDLKLPQIPSAMRSKPVSKEPEKPKQAEYVPVAEGNGNGNGKKGKAEIKDTIPVKDVPSVKNTPPASMPKPVIAEDDGDSDVDKELERELLYQAKQMDLEQDKQIPGSGWLFNIKDKHLPMQTVLDAGQVLTFALGNMQENMLNQGRTESLFKMFERDIMQMNISIKGLGREQAIMARQQDVDRNATLGNFNSLTARPGGI